MSREVCTTKLSGAKAGERAEANSHLGKEITPRRRAAIITIRILGLQYHEIQAGTGVATSTANDIYCRAVRNATKIALDRREQEAPELSATANQAVLGDSSTATGAQESEVGIRHSQLSGASVLNHFPAILNTSELQHLGFRASDPRGTGAGLPSALERVDLEGVTGYMSGALRENTLERVENRIPELEGLLDNI